MRELDPEKIAGILRDVAARRIVPRFRTLQNHELSTKTGPNDLVTIADREAEEDLTRILCDLLPGSNAVGEEAVSEGRATIESLLQEEGYVWVIDPVDGTNNFAAGTPVFGSILALVYKGETIASWIYDIPGNRMAVAQKGGGVTINGGPATLHPGQDMKTDRCFVGLRYMPDDIRNRLKAGLDHVGDSRSLMCCAHEYMALLSGDAAFAIYYRLKPWDHLAGVMIVQEAGGHAVKWDASAYIPGDAGNGLIASGSKSIHNNAMQIFFNAEMTNPLVLRR